MDRWRPARNPRITAACRPSVLRDAPRCRVAAPQDEENCRITSNKAPHPEEAATRPSRRTHAIDPAMTPKTLPLDAAGLVDERQRLREPGERIGVGRRRTLLRRAAHDDLLCFAERGHDHAVEIGSARPGAVVLGEQV